MSGLKDGRPLAAKTLARPRRSRPGRRGRRRSPWGRPPGRRRAAPPRRGRWPRVGALGVDRDDLGPHGRSGITVRDATRTPDRAVVSGHRRIDPALRRHLRAAHAAGRRGAHHRGRSAGQRLPRQELPPARHALRRHALPLDEARVGAKSTPRCSPPRCACACASASRCCTPRGSSPRASWAMAVGRALKHPLHGVGARRGGLALHALPREEAPHAARCSPRPGGLRQLHLHPGPGAARGRPGEKLHVINPAVDAARLRGALRHRRPPSSASEPRGQDRAAHRRQAHPAQGPRQGARRPGVAPRHPGSYKTSRGSCSPTARRGRAEEALLGPRARRRGALGGPRLPRRAAALLRGGGRVRAPQPHPRRRRRRGLRDGLPRGERGGAGGDRRALRRRGRRGRGRRVTGLLVDGELARRGGRRHRRAGARPGAPCVDGAARPGWARRFQWDAQAARVRSLAAGDGEADTAATTG
jgi:hypothetical protein